jgi:hypothetical protein
MAKFIVKHCWRWHTFFTATIRSLRGGHTQQANLSPSLLSRWTELRHMCCTKRTVLRQMWNTKCLLTMTIMGTGLSTKTMNYLPTQISSHPSYSFDAILKPQGFSREGGTDKTAGETVQYRCLVTSPTANIQPVACLGSLRQKEKQSSHCLQDIT